MQDNCVSHSMFCSCVCVCLRVCTYVRENVREEKPPLVAFGHNSLLTRNQYVENVEVPQLTPAHRWGANWHYANVSPILPVSIHSSLPICLFFPHYCSLTVARFPLIELYSLSNLQESCFACHFHDSDWKEGVLKKMHRGGQWDKVEQKKEKLLNVATCSAPVRTMCFPLGGIFVISGLHC